MCRTSTVFITGYAPFSKRRILLREPPTPQDDDSLVHRPPPLGQGAKTAFIYVYVHIYACVSAAPTSLGNKTKGNCHCRESYPSNPPDLLLTLRFLRCRSWCSPLSPREWIYRHVEMLGWSNRVWIWDFCRVASFDFVSLFFSFSTFLFVYFWSRGGFLF